MIDLDKRKVALVFGGGGVAGWLFHTGVADAFEEIGWKPNSAALMIGTSAGSSAATMLRLGRSAEELYVAFTYEPTAAERREAAERRNAIPRQWRPLSPKLLWAGLRSGRSGVGRAFAGLLPPGRWSPHYLGRADPGFAGPWPEDLWIPAVDANTGGLVVLGREERPPLATAIAASSALPFLFHPVRTNGRCLIDGGVSSPTHAELAAEAAVDLVVISSPMTRPGFRLFALHARHRLRDEIATLRAEGITAVVAEPDEAVGDAFRAFPRRDRNAAVVLRKAGKRAALSALRHATRVNPPPQPPR